MVVSCCNAAAADYYCGVWRIMFEDLDWCVLYWWIGGGVYSSGLNDIVLGMFDYYIMLIVDFKIFY